MSSLLARRIAAGLALAAAVCLAPSGAGLQRVLAAEPARASRPPPMPRGVTATPRSASEIVVTWAPPQELGATEYEIIRGDEPVGLVSATSFRDEGLAPWTEYCYAVRACDMAGTRSVVSKAACARTLDDTPPTVPAGARADAVSSSQIVLFWSPAHDDAGVVEYEVAREGGATVARVAETRASDAGLAAWTTYCYTIRARDPAGNWSAPSKPACARTPDAQPPSAPPGLTAVARSDTEIELAWQPSSDDGRVAYYLASRAGSRFARTEGTRALLDGLAPAREYCAEVVAVDEAGNRSAPSKACARTPDLEPPTTPRELVVGAVSTSELAIQFGPSTDDVGVAGYEVLRGPEVVARVTAPYATERGLAAGAERCYRVRALDAAGNRSSETEEVCARTTSDPSLPEIPRHVRATPVAGGVLVQWDATAKEGAAYSISWENDRAVGATRETSFTVRALKSGEQHCYRVATIDLAGRFSDRSLPACAAPGPAPAPVRLRSNVAEANTAP
jgi:chitodextrinase